MKQNFKFILTGILTLILALSFTSAALTFTYENKTANPGASVSGTITITNTTANVTNVTLTAAGITFSDNSFVVDGSKTITYTLTVPLNQAPSAYSPAITINESGTISTQNLQNLTINPISQLTLTPNKVLISGTQAGIITLNNTGNIQINSIKLLTVSTAAFNITYNDSSALTGFNLAPFTSRTFSISNSTNLGNLNLGDDNQLTIRATNGTINSTDTIVEVSLPFCDSENPGQLSIDIDNVDVTKGYGDSDSFWYPLDNVSIDVNIDNKGNSDIKSIEMKFCLLDTSNGKCVIDEGDVDFSKDKFSLKEGKDTTITISFEVDPDKLKEDSTDYVIYVGAEGKIDDSSSTSDNQLSCNSDSQDIEIRQGEEFIILGHFDYQEPVSCGSTIQVSGEAWNIDSDNVEDVVINIKSTDFNLNKDITISDISSFDSEPFEFSFNVPQTLAEKTYSIRFTVYNNDGDIFENEEGDKAQKDLSLRVLGSCIPAQSIVSLNASLASSAKVGEELKIAVTINNPGNMTDFVIAPTAYESWAELKSVEPVILNVPASSSRQATITFIPTKTGAQTFTIQAVYNGKTITQQVAVTIADKTSIFSDLNLGSTTLYIVSGIVLLLIIIVIVLIVRVSSRKSEF